ncbi:hypothetical protein HO173_006100 [Letharia columbiana]|uniref:HMG box domain-containing protein n=1 Tax=Letharia columbiana TaxID=112416 RepID=A0A8H6FW98_9LECA|nr:uncharacterized protein HO173_006100 [Letharia columbiana]KAF6235904.1 hypothetical protein HO173_006100 [Letharia columbiana]
MTDLHPVLSRLGLAQYVERFSEEGFETWETVLDITESDLDTLGVKLGHRRVLQREIAQTQGVTMEQLHSSFRSGHRDHRQSNGGDESRTDGQDATGAGGKRKYRRHPKTDENAPERPPSAYVIFSNKIREELKPENLSFTAIAKRVGERWQDVSAEEKEPYESEASAAKEKYHAEMADYKTTRSYRVYQQYLAEFKAKHATNSGGKRPKLTPEETQESTTSSGSAECQLDGIESLSGSSDLMHRRVGSVSSGGLYSATSGLPSPTSVTSGAAVRRGGLSSLTPLGNTSPLSASPSTPSARRESSTSQLFHNSAQGRPSAERQDERMAMTSSGPDQSYTRIVALESREARKLQGHGSGPFIEPRRSGGRRSPLESPRRSARVPTQPQDVPSDSSKSSIGSTLLSTGTAASSLYSPASFDGERKSALSLPPLGSNPSSKGSSYAEPAARPTLQPLASRTASSFAPDQPAQSPFNSSSSTGMKFESLQLPLPYNISFGQHPLPRPDSGGKLANLFDLQDTSRKRNSLRDLSLEHEQGVATPPIPQGPPEPRHPPHHPNLPSFPSLLRDDTHEPFPHDADPLAVLAYAGRIVGRERGTPRPH